MSASERIDKLICDTPDWRGHVMAKLRKIILSADPAIFEEWKWMGTPTYAKNDIICVMNPHKGKVKIMFSDGAALADPNKVFNASLEGKKWRAIDFFEGDKIDERALKALFKEAAAHDATKRKRGETKAKPKPRR